MVDGKLDDGCRRSLGYTAGARGGENAQLETMVLDATVTKKDFFILFVLACGFVGW